MLLGWFHSSLHFFFTSYMLSCRLFLYLHSFLSRRAVQGRGHTARNKQYSPLRVELTLLLLQILCWYILGGGGFLTALILAMCRTVTQDQRGAKANFFFVSIPAQLTPFAMMFMSLLMGGPAAVLMQLCGFVAAHLYDFLSRIYPEFIGGHNLIPTPAFLSRFVDTPRVFDRGFGTAIRPRTSAQEAQQPSAARTTGASTGSGPLPDAWRTRGPGRRLGD